VSSLFSSTEPTDFEGEACKGLKAIALADDAHGTPPTPSGYSFSTMSFMTFTPFFFGYSINIVIDIFVSAGKPAKTRK